MKATAPSALDKITGNATSQKIYRALLVKLEKIGEFEVEPKGGSIHIVHERAFLGVHYRKDGLLLNIVLDRALRTPRLKKSEQVSRSRHHNEVLLSAPADLDREMVGWLEEAHALTGR